MASLCLGTVQFGMKYGINNTLGQPAEEDVFRMLDVAIDRGIDVIDTARAYGTAELILGRYFDSRKNQKDIKIISKLRPNVIESGETDIRGIVRQECEETLRRLRIECLDGYLLHTPGYIRDPKIVDALLYLKELKLVKNIGVSIYEIEDGDVAVSTGAVDYIQLPYSVFDQRGMKEGFIPKAKNAGIKIFTRSAFLQGLFFMEDERIPAHLNDAKQYLKVIHSVLDKYDLKMADLLLQFVTQEDLIDYLVFGVDTVDQLQEDIASFHENAVPAEAINEIKSSLGEIDKSIIFPSLWSNGKKAE